MGAPQGSTGFGGASGSFICHASNPELLTLTGFDNHGSVLAFPLVGGRTVSGQFSTEEFDVIEGDWVRVFQASELRRAGDAVLLGGNHGSDDNTEGAKPGAGAAPIDGGMEDVAPAPVNPHASADVSTTPAGCCEMLVAPNEMSNKSIK